MGYLTQELQCLRHREIPLYSFATDTKREITNRLNERNSPCWLQQLDAQQSEQEHTVEIGLSSPDAYSLSVTFFPQMGRQTAEEEEAGE